MKDIDKLINSLEKKIDMYFNQSSKFKEKGSITDHAHCDGIQEGIRIAIDEIQKLNESLTKKLSALL